MRKQHGVTLLETLIAILVLSFGMLGMLGVIINSLKLTTSSNYRTIAAQQAYSMADLLRGTPALLAENSGQGYSGLSYTDPESNCLKTAGCDKAKLMKTQLYIWQEGLKASLPSGSGIICRDTSADNANGTDWKCTNTGPYVVKVCWDETRVAIADGKKSCARANI